MGIRSMPAVRKALARAGLEPGDTDLFELNEAFAAQSPAALRELDIDPERINRHCGAIALGHPIGASGGRILVTLVHEMRHRDSRRGLATPCVGGGQGQAAIIRQRGTTSVTEADPNTAGSAPAASRWPENLTRSRMQPGSHPQRGSRRFIAQSVRGPHASSRWGIRPRSDPGA
jgi:Thiolase, C-terminal domain